MISYSYLPVSNVAHYHWLIVANMGQIHVEQTVTIVIVLVDLSIMEEKIPLHHNPSS
jgi:hypothetical protein